MLPNRSRQLGVAKKYIVEAKKFHQKDILQIN